MKNIAKAFLFLAFVPLFLFGAEISFSPEKIHTSVNGDHTFTVEIKFFGSENFLNIKIDADESLQLSNPVVSTSTIIVNGQKRSIHVYGYSIYPLSGGNYRISFTVSYLDGLFEKTLVKTLDVNVRGDSIPLYQKEKTASGIPVLTAINPIKMTMSVSNPSPYVNEQVTAELSVYSKFKLLKQPYFTYYPSFNGFWAETGDSFFKAYQIQTEFGTVFKYSMRWSLFPVQAGQAFVGKAGAEIVISSYPLLPRKLNLFSDSVELTVKPLPSAGIPPGFKGSVGNFLILLETPTQVSADSASEIYVIVSGTGNIKGIEDIEIPPVEGGEIYYSSSEINIESREPMMKGKKVMGWTLIPNSSDRVILSGISFSYFDPSISSYVTSSTLPCTIKVTGSSATQRIQEQKDTLDLNYSLRELRFSSMPYSFILATFLFSIAFLILGTARYMATKGKLPSKKVKKSKTHRSHLKEAEKHHSSGNYAKCFLYLKKALQSYFSSSQNEKPGFREISSKVSEITKSDYYDQIFSELEKIEFSGKEFDHEIFHILKEVKGLFNKIEKTSFNCRQ
ncbi:BatD family protein [candidate division WOR-3 bacterium]|nr:BatD family protein [candidate division WOR-3 bacterium]